MTRIRVAVVLAVLVLLGAVLVATISSSPTVALDPQSAAHDGSKALARLLTRYGAPVRRVTTVAASGSAATTDTAVLVTAPDDYSTSQLRRLRDSNALLVLIAPDERAVAGVLPGATVGATAGSGSGANSGSGSDAGATSAVAPGCADPGARAAGTLELPDDAASYDYAGSCYGGSVIVTPRVAVLGTPQLLRNDRLTGTGVAAVDVNTVTRNRSLTHVTWLLPGSDVSTGPASSLWQLFPPGARRAFWWLLAVGALLVCWRARRLGGVVREPLPVVVRATEAVEGHGRLYQRAGARDRAAAALRRAAARRIAARLGLPRTPDTGADADRVALAAAPLAGAAPAQLRDLLAGPPPADDAALLRLARDLDAVAAEVDGRINR